MKKIVRILFYVNIAMMSSMLISCGGSEKKEADEKLGKLEIEIPENLESNDAAVQYVNEMNLVVDDYAMLMDELVEEVGEYKGMKEEDLGMMDKLKLTTAMAKVAMESTQIMARWGECTDKRMNMEQKLSEEEIEALNLVYKRFEERMEQVKNRHQEFFAEEETDE